MITYSSANFNNNYQKYYNNCIDSLNIFSISCSCKAKGQMIRYGFYERCIKTPLELIKLRIQRVRCKACGRTHAILLSCMVPYSQVLMNDMISIIRTHSPDEINKFMLNNPLIDESNISYIKKQFHLHWKQRLLSECIDFNDSLVFQCFSHYQKQFMQIKCTFNSFLTDTNIT